MKLHILPVGTVFFRTNCCLLAFDDSAVIVDPGFEGRRVAEAARALGKPVAAVLLTHGHSDHTGGLPAVMKAFDCPVMIGADDAYRLPQRPDRLLQDGDRLVFGGETVEVLSTPGHTEGSVCFLMPGLMLSGDTLFYRSVGRTDLSGGDSGALTASLRRLCALPDDYRVIPGHGRETTLSAEKAGNPYLAADGERKL